MSKFSTFLVFVFGIFVMVAVTVMLAQKVFSPPQQAKREERIVLPQNDMPRLDIGGSDAMAKRLDKLFAEGGIDAVKQYVEAEFATGRKILLGPGTAPVRIVDREIRRCDASGVALMDRPPVLPRKSATLRLDDTCTMETWTRAEPAQPYLINVWVSYPKN